MRMRSPLPFDLRFVTTLLIALRILLSFVLDGNLSGVFIMRFFGDFLLKGFRFNGVLFKPVDFSFGLVLIIQATNQYHHRL